MNFLSTLGAKAKYILHGIVNLGGNAAIIALLPSVLPKDWVAIIFLGFNLAAISWAFFDPTYTVHLIQTGAMSVPPAPKR